MSKYIYYDDKTKSKNKRYCFYMNMNKKRHQKCFHTLKEAEKYRYEYCKEHGKLYKILGLFNDYV